MVQAAAADQWFSRGVKPCSEALGPVERAEKDNIEL